MAAKAANWLPTPDPAVYLDRPQNPKEAAQFVVGYTMDLDSGCDPPGEDRSGGDTSDAEEERLEEGRRILTEANLDGLEQVDTMDGAAKRAAELAAAGK